MPKAARESVIATMAAQEQVQEQLLQLPNVIGVGTGLRVKNGKITNEVCVQVLVDKKMAPESLSASETVPTSVEGPQGATGTDVLQVSVEAQQDTGRYRPVPGGVSIGPEARVSAGTLGGWACDHTDETTVFLTNNHVISDLDAMPLLRRVVQPGRLDGGVLPADVIGQLKRDVTVNTVPNVAGANPPASVVDAAISTIDVELTHDIRQIGVPAIYEIQAPALAMNVQKRGRTTRFTNNGRITTINTTILLTYRNRTRLGRVQNSFIITSTDGALFSDAGDSGSLILNQDRGVLEGTFPVVGLLYGGGTDAMGTPITIANDINSVFGALNLETLCSCVARAVLRAILGGSEAGAAEVMRKERQLRRLRDQLEGTGKFGAAISALINQETARVGRVLAQDEKAFNSLVRGLKPFVETTSSEDLLRTRLTRESLEHLLAFSTRVTAGAPELRRKLSAVKQVASAVEGMRLDRILRSAELVLGARGAVSRRSRTRRR